MTVVALSLAFPEGGAQPFSVASFATAVGVSLGVAVAVRRDRGLRLAPLLYVAAVVASFAIASPDGRERHPPRHGVRGPLVLVAAGRWSRSRGTIVVAVVLAAAAVWQWVDPAVQAARAWRDPSASAVYYRPLLTELRRADPSGARIEVPFTRDHWESVFLARRYPLARGWERQLDRRLNPLFYAPRLDAAAYGRWLRSEAVRYVALPDVPMDVAGIREARSWCPAPRSSSRSGAGPTGACSDSATRCRSRRARRAASVSASRTSASSPAARGRSCCACTGRRTGS